MPSESNKRKKLLFVDDDPKFLAVIQTLFLQMSKGSWDISTANNHAQALEILRRGQVDLVVLDFKMPVVDGLQFLKLLARTHPGQQAVVLSGHANGADRKACEESGAAMVLQKPVAHEGFEMAFSALDALAGAAHHEGFSGVMRRLGISDVIQMECLGLKSSVLEIFTGRVRGRIFIREGAIIHAESGAIQGETALFGLLGLRGGEFNFSEYTEPPCRTIEGQWEGLLMAAAQLLDEGQTTSLESENPEVASDVASEIASEAPPEVVSKVAPEVAPEFFSKVAREVAPQIAPEIASQIAQSQTAKPPPAAPPVAATKPQFQPAKPPAEPAPAAPIQIDTGPQIEEILLGSNAGNVLYEWGCKRVDGRLKLMEQIEQQAREVSEAVKVGVFDRLEIITPRGRVVCQVQPQRRIFVRSTRGKKQSL